jgi:cytochrome c peroxidase
MHIRILVFLLLTAAVGFVACKDDDNPIIPVLPSDAEIIAKNLNISLDNVPNYANPTLPNFIDQNILAQDNAPSINPVTDKGAQLGRVLFYDKNLSRNGTTACASCHQQAKGFSDDAVKSLGFEGALTGQHSMRLANTNFYTGERMFWNKRARDLEEQATMPIKDMGEMGFDAAHGGIDSLLRKMRKLEYYPVLFEQAFGNEEITEAKIQQALAQFIRSMISSGSKFDQGFAQVFAPGAPGAGVQNPFPNFTAQENTGKNLFLLPPPQGGAGCAGCHTPPTFALAANSLSNGLNAGETVIFKSPSLKNIGIGGPYMHDGRFATLEQVVEHYNSGIQNAPSLDNRLRTPNGQPLRLNLNADQKAALVAFLKTLDDPTLSADPKFATPFK